MRKIYRKLPAVHFPSLHMPTVRQLRQLRYIAFHKKFLPIVLGVLGIIVIIFIANLIRARMTRAAWYDDSFQYRQTVAITNSGSAQTDFQVAITLDTATLITASKMQSDCDDIRVTGYTGELFPHWIEEGSAPCNNASTMIWVKVPSIPTTGVTLLVYYGNATATSIADINQVFAFGDDFNSGSAISSKWLQTGASSISNGALTITTGAVYTPAAFMSDSRDYMYEYRAQWSSTVVSYAGMSINSTISSAVSNNSESDKLIFSLSNGATNLAQRGYAADGTAASYNLENNVFLYTPSAATYYVDGFSMNGTQIRHWNNGSQTGSTVTGTWTAAPFMYLGYYQGSTSSTTNITDITIDWVRVRKFAATAPTVGSPSNEEKTIAPLSYWKFDEGTGLTANDGSSNQASAMFGLPQGDGIDGNITVSTSKNLNTDVIATGRSTYADGIAYRVIAPADSATSVTRFSGSDTISNGIAVGDEVLLINLRGTTTDNADVGKYEYMEVSAISSSVITFSKATTVSVDGTTASNQFVVIQRVPNYGNVTVSSGGTITASAWEGLTTTPTGGVGYLTGVIAFRASGTLTVASGGTINANAIGYRGGAVVSGNTIGNTGETIRASASQTAALNSAGGGGTAHNPGVCNPGAGGGGGHGASGTSSSNKTNSCAGGGIGGGSLTSNRALLYLGGGGGSGGGKASGGTSGVGGNAGGIINISARTITVAGSITANGQNGGAPSLTTDSGGDSGGGGSGGVVYLRAPSLTIGSSLVTATGGTGGTTSSHANGGNGAVGYVNLDYVSLLSGTSSPGADTTTQLGTNPSWTTEDQCIAGKCMYFNGTTSYGSVSTTLPGIKSVSLWIKPISVTSGAIADFDGGTHTITYSSGTVTANGFSNPTYYINGVPGRTLTEDVWQMLTITTTTGFDSTPGLTLGKSGVTYMNGFLDEVKTYGYTRSAAQVNTDFSSRGSVHGVAAAAGGNGQSGLDTLSNNLAGYWKLDETSGNAVDSSGNGSTLTNTGTTTFTTGKFGNAPDMNGSTQYFTLADNPALSTGDIDFTLSTWVYLDVVNVDQALISKEDAFGGGSVAEYRLDFTDSGDKVRFYVTDSAHNSIGSVSDTTTLVASTWYHVIAWHDSVANTVNIQVNNGEVNTVATSGVPSDTAAVFYLGARGGPNDGLNGRLDEVRFYKRKLTPVERSALYAFAPGPVGYWKMDENAGTTSTVDSSGNNKTATLNSITDDNWAPGKLGSSLDFDGTADTADILGGVTIAGEVSLALWMNPDTNVSMDAFGACNDPNSACTGSDYDGIIIRKNATNSQIQFAVYTFRTTGTGNCSFTTTAGIPTGSWTHIAATFNKSDNTSAKIYFNGVEQNYTTSCANSVAATITVVPSIGGIYISNNGVLNSRANYVNGRVDDVRLYNYVRTAQQVVSDMNGDHPAGGSPISSMLAAWHFDEGFGTTANNYGFSSTASGTLSNFASPATPTSGWQNTGKINKALMFDGVDDSISAGSDASLDNIASISASAWIYPKSSGEGGFGRIFDKSSWVVYLNGATEIGTTVSYASSGAACNTSGANIQLNTWQHVTFTYDGSSDCSKVKVYVNGKSIPLTQAGAGTGGRLSDAASNMLIGNSSGGDRTFDGMIDEPKLYNYSLTAAQVALDANAGSGISLGTLSTTIDSNSNVSGANPAVYWKFDEVGAVNSADSSGNGTTLTTTNSATHGMGVYGNSASVSATTSQYYTAADNSFVSAGNVELTITAWVKATSLGANRDIITKWGSAGTNAQLEYQLGYSHSGTRFYFQVGDGTNIGSAEAPSSPAPSTNTWYFIVAQHDPVADTISISVNAGTPNTFAWTTGIQDSTYNVSIGRAGANNFNYWNGFIDDVRIYKKVLTTSQINSLYTLAPAPTAYWNMDEKTGTTTIDKAGNGYTATLTGGPTWDSGKVGSAIKFDGTDDYLTIPDNDVLDNGVNSFTFSFWIKTADTDAFLIQKRVEASTLGYNMYIGSGLPRFQIGDGINTVTNTPGGMVVNDNTWHFMTMIVDRTNNVGKIFIDGVQQGSNITITAVTGTLANSQALEIGRAANATSYVAGWLDDVKMYNYVRTQAQIMNDFSRGAPYAMYSLDECSGGSAYNTAPSATGSGNFNTATITIGGTGSNTSLGTCGSGTSTQAWNNGTTGKRNNSLDFDGTDDYAGIDADSVNFRNFCDFNSATGFSVAAWFKMASAPANGVIFMWGSSSSNNPLCGLNTSNGSVRFEYRSDNNTEINGGSAFMTSQTYNDGAWHHAVVVRNGNVFSIYVDGQLKKSMTDTSGFNTVTANRQTIGALRRATTASYFDGQIDDVRIYRYALTPTQIQQIMNNGAVNFGPAEGSP